MKNLSQLVTQVSKEKFGMRMFNDGKVEGVPFIMKVFMRCFLQEHGTRLKCADTLPDSLESLHIDQRSRAGHP
jgi:hypothetical protein